MRSKQKPTMVLCVVVALVLAAAVPQKVKAAEDVATAQIKWPKWFWCFPECVFGETCFFHIYHFCMKSEPTAGLVLCTVVALDWCDLAHVFQWSGRHPPRAPGRKALASASDQ